MTATRYYDPPSVGEDRHPVLSLADDLGLATDDYADALNEEAAAEVAYKHHWATAMLSDEKVAATLRSKFAEAKSIEEQARWTWATAKVKRCRAKVDQLNSQLMAHQSYLRHLGNVT